MDNKNIKLLYNKINNNTHYVIFGKSNCLYCRLTREFLKKYKIKYKYYPIDDSLDLFFRIFEKLADIYPSLNIDKKHKTVPVIFYKKKFIGGYTNIQSILD